MIFRNIAVSKKFLTQKLGVLARSLVPSPTDLSSERLIQALMFGYVFSGEVKEGWFEASDEHLASFKGLAQDVGEPRSSSL